MTLQGGSLDTRLQISSMDESKMETEKPAVKTLWYPFLYPLEVSSQEEEKKKKKKKKKKREMLIHTPAWLKHIKSLLLFYFSS